MPFRIFFVSNKVSVLVIVGIEVLTNIECKTMAFFVVPKDFSSLLKHLNFGHYFEHKKSNCLIVRFLHQKNPIEFQQFGRCFALRFL